MNNYFVCRNCARYCTAICNECDFVPYNQIWNSSPVDITYIPVEEISEFSNTDYANANTPVIFYRKSNWQKVTKEVLEKHAELWERLATL